MHSKRISFYYISLFQSNVKSEVNPSMVDENSQEINR